MKTIILLLSLFIFSCSDNGARCFIVVHDKKGNIIFKERITNIENGIGFINVVEEKGVDDDK